MSDVGEFFSDIFGGGDTPEVPVIEDTSADQAEEEAQRILRARRRSRAAAIVRQQQFGAFAQLRSSGSSGLNP